MSGGTREVLDTAIERLGARYPGAGLSGHDGYFDVETNSPENQAGSRGDRRREASHPVRRHGHAASGVVDPAQPRGHAQLRDLLGWARPSTMRPGPRNARRAGWAVWGSNGSIAWPPTPAGWRAADLVDPWEPARSGVDRLRQRRRSPVSETSPLTAELRPMLLTSGAAIWSRQSPPRTIPSP